MWLLLCLALAAPSASVQYNDQLVSVEWGLTEELADLAAQPYDVSDPAAVAARVQALAGALDAAAARVAALEPLPGDPGLRDAVAAGIVETRVVLAETLPRVGELLRASPPTDADVAALEQTWQTMIQRLTAADASVREAQAAFAQRFHFRLVAAERAEQRGAAAFEAPELVPAGSVLPAGFHAILALNYRDHAVGSINRLVSDHDAFAAGAVRVEALRAATTTFRGAVRRERRLLEAWGPWRGDDDLRVELLGALTDLDGALAGDFLRYVTLAEDPRRKPKEEAELDEAFRRSTTVIAASMERLPAAVEAFDRRWALDRYGVWAQGVLGPPPSPGAPTEAAPTPGATPPSGATQPSETTPP